MRGTASRWYLCAGTLALVSYAAMPRLGDSPGFFLVVGLSTVVAIGLGIFWHRPVPELPWILFAVAQLFAAAAHFCVAALDLSFPSYADGLYIAFVVLQAAGLLLLVRSRSAGRNSESLVDALIVATGVGLLLWVYVITPGAGQSGVSHAARLISATYPALDVLLLLVAVRLVTSARSRPAAFHLMVSSLLFLIASDAVYGSIQLNGSYEPGGWPDLGWMAAYVLWGAAALHPSMGELSAPALHERAQANPTRLALLAAATLVAPAMLLADSQWPVRGFDVRVVAGASVAVFVLVMYRMFGLVIDERRAVNRHRRAERREIVLRHATTALAVAGDRERICQAAITGARELVRGLSEAEVELDISDDQTSAAGPATASPNTVVAALSTQTASYGRLSVTSAAPVPIDVADGLQTLGAQVALALESASFAERLNEERREAWVGALVQNATDVIMVLDARLRIRYVTPSVFDALGHDPGDLAGVSVLDLVEPAEEPALTAFLSPERRPGDSDRAVWRIRRGDGLFTDVEVVRTDLLKNPSVNGIVVTARDITERLALQAGLERQVRELEELNRIRSDFVAAVSHELRTPLACIIGQVEMLADGELGELTDEQARSAEVVGRNSERLLSLIDDLLTLSRVESNEIHLNRAPTPVDGLVEDVSGLIAAAAAAKSVDLSVDCGPQAGPVFVDREQMGRALANLLTNAVKFTPPGGHVDLRARREGDDLVVTVADTGIGIPLDEQARLFTRFFRSSAATRLAIQGTGLGLVIVKKIVEEHGGTISVASAPDQGTTVTVKVPAGTKDTDAHAA